MKKILLIVIILCAVSCTENNKKKKEIFAQLLSQRDSLKFKVDDIIMENIDGYYFAKGSEFENYQICLDTGFMHKAGYICCNLYDMHSPEQYFEFLNIFTEIQNEGLGVPHNIYFAEYEVEVDYKNLRGDLLSKLRYEKSKESKSWVLIDTLNLFKDSIVAW